MKRTGPKYPIGSRWTVKNVAGIEKDDVVEIVDDGIPGKDRRVIVRDRVNINHVISVKKLRRRIA